MVIEYTTCPQWHHVINKPSQAQNNVYFPLYLCPEVTCLAMSSQNTAKGTDQDYNIGREKGKVDFIQVNKGPSTP